MAFASTFELRLADDTPADPPTLTTAAPLWRPGDTIPLGARTLRVLDVRDGDVDVDREAVLAGLSCAAVSGVHPAWVRSASYGLGQNRRAQ